MTSHIDIDTLTLLSGGHDKREDGVCVMEAVAWWAGLEHTDRPECTDAVVAAYARALNDDLPNDQRQRLRSYIPRLAGTKNGRSAQERAFLCADYAVRVFAVKALRDAGLATEADKLAALPVIDSASAWSAAASAWSAAESAWSALSAVSAARSALSAESAAASAAESAAASAAYDEAFALLDALLEPAA